MRSTPRLIAQRSTLVLADSPSNGFKMRPLSRLHSLTLLLSLSATVYAADKGQRLNQPPPLVVRELVKRAVILAEADKPWTAIALLKKALSQSPNYLQAHIEYRNVKANFLDHQDEVDAEYRSLIKRFPGNAVYLMALYYGTNGNYARESLQKIVDLAPEWAWGHYAKALLVKANDPEAAIVELQRCIENDSNALAAYNVLIELQEARHRIDDAIRTAERLAAQTEIRPQLRLNELWRLRLVKEQNSESAQNSLKSELSALENSQDVDTLLAVRSAYLNLLKDSEHAKSLELKIVALDPTWSKYRGWLYYFVARNLSQVPRHLVFVNRQIALHEKASEIFRATELTQGARISKLKGLLNQQPSAAMRRIIYEEIFQLAIRAGDATNATEYGRQVHAIDPQDSVCLSQMAIVIADSKKNLSEALYYARKAERLTSEFHLARRPPNTSQLVFDRFLPEQKQREEYKKDRALAMDALGWTLTRMRRPEEAEHWLREANQVERSEKGLRHWATALRLLGRDSEAAKIEAESNTFLLEALRKEFSDEAVSDLQVELLDGRKVKLSDLKGKVVLISFWATWCAPCLEEMPSLKKLYQKYKGEGLEVLEISIDEDASKVVSFVKSKSLEIPVSHAPEIGKIFKATAIPTTLFIDKRGHLRFRKTGFSEGEERETEIILRELLRQLP